MYENKSVPLDAPERFRVEILYSPGSNYNPFELQLTERDHVLPVLPRVPLHCDDGVTWNHMRSLLRPFAKSNKFAPCSYTLPGGLTPPNAKEARSSAPGAAKQP